MNPTWYLVKRNWPQTAVKLPHYAGLGGDVWPLDDVSDAQAKAVHMATMASRKHLPVGHAVELLCHERSLAEAYWAEVERHCGDAWLLEVTPATAAINPIAGFDLGFPTGGFSAIESELITQGLPGPPLNQWGVIEHRIDALAYQAERANNEELEDVDGIELLAIRVLRHSRFEPTVEDI